MALLIDCYNVLHAPMPTSLAGLEEERLCALLATSPWSRQPILVVCDGSVKPGGLAVSPFPEVSMVYSGPSKSADCVICEYVDRSSIPRQLTVVTNDREIQKSVRTRKARVMPVERFIRTLSNLVSRSDGSEPFPPSSAKPVADDMSDEEVDRWMRAFDIEDEIDLPKKNSWPSDLPAEWKDLDKGWE